MKRLSLLFLLLLALSIPSCQCSDKPDIGPVEGQTAQIPVAHPSVA
jgi:hypothetical protein